MLMVAALLTLSLVVGIFTGLYAGYAIFRMLRTVSRYLEGPRGFVFRLPGGILIFGIKTTARKQAPAERRLRLVSRINFPEHSDERLRKAA